MDRKWMTGRFRISLLLAIAFSAPVQLAAQVPVDEQGEPLAAYDDGVYAERGVPIAGAQIEEIFSLTEVELEELVGPVALYPDDLLAIVLPASTYPLEIVQAARFLDQFEIDSSLEPDESWDESVVALLNYPEVLRMLDEQIDWTWRLGEAVIGQQTDLIAAVESFRDQAYAAGNLESDDHQTVSKNDGIIEIEPVDKEIIYVPYYEPEEVVVYQPRRTVYNYYPQAYPVYYYPYPYGHSFSSGYFWGVTTAFTIGWPNRYLTVHHPSYWGHPYYGHNYYGHYYRRPSISVYNTTYVNNSYNTPSHQHRDGDYWRPRDRTSGARPANRSVRNQHYPPGGNDRERIDLRSNQRTRLDTQAANRSSSNRSRTATTSGSARTLVSANNGRRSSTSGDQRSTARQSGGDRGRRSSNDAAGARSEIRFRDRSGSDSIRADRASDVRRNTRSTGNRAIDRSIATESSAQQLLARNSRGRTSVQPASTNRTANARRAARPVTTPARQADAARTSSRSRTSRRQAEPRAQLKPVVSQQSTSQGSASRQAVQRQSSSQRTASRAASNRQAPAQRASARVKPQRQSAPRRSAPPGSSKPRAKPQRKQASSRGNSRPRSRQ